MRRNMLALLVVLAVAAGALTMPVLASARAATTTVLLPLVAHSSNAAATPFYAYYYMWWSTRHWQERLGTDYPYDGSWPLPGSLDPNNGCTATASFTGSRLTDLPAEGAYDQLTSNIMQTHVQQAAATGLSGFLAGWEGTGLPGQTVDDSGFHKRLERLTTTIRAHNSASGQAFRYIIDYENFEVVKTPEHVANDIDYLLGSYGNDAAWGRFDGRLGFRWSNTRQFPISTLQTIAERYGDRLFIIGEERANTWNAERARYLDGSGHYWSTQDPYSNPQSFAQEQAFAAQVRADGKRYFAPLAPGFNDELRDLFLGELVGPEDCVPRNGTQTMRLLYEGNRATAPNGWFVISWNEWVEHTYIEPSKRYGTLYIDELARIIAQDKAP